MFTDAVSALAQEIVNRHLSLIYGGLSLGLISILANTVKEHGGKIIGLIPKKLINKEIPLATLEELHVVDSMYERKGNPPEK